MKPILLRWTGDWTAWIGWPTMCWCCTKSLEWSMQFASSTNRWMAQTFRLNDIFLYTITKIENLNRNNNNNSKKKPQHIIVHSAWIIIQIQDPDKIHVTKSCRFLLNLRFIPKNKRRNSFLVSMNSHWLLMMS